MQTARGKLLYKSAFTFELKKLLFMKLCKMSSDTQSGLIYALMIMKIYKFDSLFAQSQLRIIYLSTTTIFLQAIFSPPLLVYINCLIFQKVMYIVLQETKRRLSPFQESCAIVLSTFLYKSSVHIAFRVVSKHSKNIKFYCFQ